MDQIISTHKAHRTDHSDDFKLIIHCSKVANKSFILSIDLQQFLYGMDWIEFLGIFGIIHQDIKNFSEKIGAPTNKLANISLYLEGDNPFYQPERHSPQEFQHFDPFIQGIARRLMNKVNHGFNYHLLVPVAEAIEEIINAAGGSEKIKKMILKNGKIHEDNPALLSVK